MDVVVNTAKNLFRVAHKASPFMTLESGPDGVFLNMKFRNLKDGQEVYTAMVDFFDPKEERKALRAKKCTKKAIK